MPIFAGAVMRAASFHPDNRRMRILLVTQMWPSDEEPDLGSFLVPSCEELEALGHEVEVAALSRRGGAADQVRGADPRLGRGGEARRPDVVFAHFLFPAGLAGAWRRAPPTRRSWSWPTARTSPTSAGCPGVTAATKRVVNAAPPR